MTEAMRLVGEGYVSPADLDKTISAGLGLRWSFLGPFATIELNAPGGVPDYCARYADFYRALAQTPAGPEAWSAANASQVAEAMAVAATNYCYNTFFKFRALSGSGLFEGMGVGLRAHVFTGTSLDEKTVELLNIAISDINACKPCTATAQIRPSSAATSACCAIRPCSLKALSSLMRPVSPSACRTCLPRRCRR